MENRISMKQAFELANLDFPDGVTHQMSQASTAQVPSLIREQDPNRKKLKDALKKATCLPSVTAGNPELSPQLLAIFSG